MVKTTRNKNLQKIEQKEKKKGQPLDYELSTPFLLIIVHVILLVLHLCDFRNNFRIRSDQPSSNQNIHS